MLTQEFTNHLKSFTGFESRNDFMLYPSGMLVVRPANDGTGEIRYTKHYYAGAERVSSKIGTTTNLGSFLRDWTLMENSTEFPENPVINGKEQLRKAEQAVRRVYTAFGMNTTVTPGTDAFNPVFAFTHQSAEPDQYYYHPDHLGSSSYITNADGVVNQHMEYFAFGESFVDEHLNSYNTPYKFNGKELDEETGWYYYGARYYDPRVSLWLGVDPLAEKYPGMSPYNYCANNPVMLVDPDGRSAGPPDEWDVNVETGQKTWKSNLGGSEVQVLNFYTLKSNGDKIKAAESKTINSSEVYTGIANRGVAYSSRNLWQDLSKGYNANSGYNYTLKDLQLRYVYINSRIFRPGILEREGMGKAEPFGLEDWIDYYGTDYYNAYRLGAGVELAFSMTVPPAAKISYPKGFKYTKVLDHISARKIKRGVTQAEIDDALASPLYEGDVKLDNWGRPSQKIIGKSATVVINPNTGKRISTWRTGSKIVEKYTK